MIPLEFEYHRPESVREALSAFHELAAHDRRPVYYGGGTELITRARAGSLDTGAVLDLKAIPECAAVGAAGAYTVFGAGASLDRICELNDWPLLSAAAGRVADHTVRRQITLGGNLAGQIRYREAALPFLLVDAVAVVAGPRGLSHQPFAQVFDGRLQLAPDQFLAQLRVNRDDLLPGVSVKQTRLDWVDYPLVTTVALRRQGQVRAAFSGLCEQPFRSAAMEEALNDRQATSAERAAEAVHRIPEPVLDDLHGSAAYRRFVLEYTIADILDRLDNA